MTKKTAKGWSLEQNLASLIDALTAELLATPDAEVEACLSEAGAKGRSAIAAMRRLLTDIDADAKAPPASSFVAPGMAAHLTRMQ